MIFRRLANDATVYGGADLLTKLLSFFTFPIIAAALSPKAFGALELISTITALLGLAMNCGLTNSLQRFYWDKDTKSTMLSAIVTSGFYVEVFFGFVAILAGLVAIPFILPSIHSDGWPLTWVALFSALLVMVFSQLCNYILDVIRLHFAPWRFFILALTSRVITIAFGVLSVVLFGLGIDGLLAAQALVFILVLPLGLWLIRKDFKPRHFATSWMKEMVKFGYPFIFASMAYWLFGTIDRWMLASMTTVEEVGIYSVAFKFSSIVMFVSAAFGQAWAPVAIKLQTDHPEQYRAIYGQVLLFLLYVMLIVGGGVALFSGEAISIIMPLEYHASALSLAILCFAIILQATQQITAIGISIEKKTYMFARLAWLTALVNLIINWLMIPRYGAAGAAWATLFSYIVLTSSYLYCTQRLHPILIQWRPLIILLILSCLLAIVSVTFISMEVTLYIFLFKAALAAFCLFVGWRVLPLHSFKEVNV